MKGKSGRTAAAACVLVLFFGLGSVTFAAEKHPFRAEDWAVLRNATAIAVSPDGQTILYRVDFGGEKGPTNHEWRLIAADASNPRKLALPEHFRPHREKKRSRDVRCLRPGQLIR